MLDALTAAFRDRWTTTDELLHRLILEVNVARREQIVMHGGEDPGAIDLPRPGEAKKPPAWKSALSRMVKGG